MKQNNRSSRTSIILWIKVVQTKRLEDVMSSLWTTQRHLISKLTVFSARSTCKSMTMLILIDIVARWTTKMISKATWRARLRIPLEHSLHKWLRSTPKRCFLSTLCASSMGSMPLKDLKLPVRLSSLYFRPTELACHLLKCTVMLTGSVLKSLASNPISLAEHLISLPATRMKEMIRKSGPNRACGHRRSGPWITRI